MRKQKRVGWNELPELMGKSVEDTLKELSNKKLDKAINVPNLRSRIKPNPDPINQTKNT